MFSAVIVITDGEERASYYRKKDLIELLRKIDVKLFVIALAVDEKGEFNKNQPKRSIGLFSELATETGGKAYFPKSIPELERMIMQMMKWLRSGYVIGYEPATPVVVGSYRKVKVNLVSHPQRENWTVLTRAGYIVPKREMP